MAAARAGRLGCALLSMVCSITLERAARKGRRSGDAVAPPPSAAERAALEDVAAVHEASRGLSLRLRALEDADRAAFTSFLEASRLPRSTDRERAARTSARQRAARDATEAPLSLLEAARDAVALGIRLLRAADAVSLRAESDLFGAMELARATFRTAELNVRVNWPALSPADAAALRPRWEEAARALRASWEIVEDARRRLLPDPG